MRKLAMFVYGNVSWVQIPPSSSICIKPQNFFITNPDFYLLYLHINQNTYIYFFMIAILLSNFDLTIQAFAASYLLIATEYIIVSPDFFSALAFVSFLTYAYSAANGSVNKSLFDAEQASNKELTSVISTKSARLSEKLAILEVEQECLLAISQTSGRFHTVQTSSVSYTDALLQDSIYSAASLSHISTATRHVNALYSSLLDAAMFGSRGYYTLAKSAFSASTGKSFSKGGLRVAKSFTASFVNKRSGSSDSVITVSALNLGASSKKLALVGAASSIRKGKSTRSKKETFISKIATKLSSRTSDQEEVSKKSNSGKGKKR